MAIVKNLKRNISYLSKVARFASKNLPTRRERRVAAARTGAVEFNRGLEIGARRAHNSYHPGASKGVLSGDQALDVKSATTVIREDFETICARAEMAYRTDSVTRKCVNTIQNYVVGQGNQPYPCVKNKSGEADEAVNDRLSEDWERFNDQCIRTGNTNITGYQAQALKCTTMATYGSVIQNVVRSKPGSLLPWAFQLLKPTRLDFSKDTFNYSDDDAIKRSTIVHGMELNRYGEVTGYHFNGEDTMRSASKIDLMFHQIEAEQYLGISWLTPSLPAIFDRQQLIFDKLKQSKIGAKLGMRLPREMQEGIESLNSTTSEGDEFFDLDFQGFVFADKDIKPVTITDPISNSFEALIRMIMQEIAMGFGFSYQRATSDLKDANFTSGRINTIADIKFFNILFKMFTKTGCQPDYNRFIEWEAYTGRLLDVGVGYSDYLSDPWRFNQCYWLPKDSEDWVDPLKDAEALLLLYKAGIVSFGEMCTMKGKSAKSMIAKLSKERKDIIAAGLESILPENVSATSKISATPQPIDSGDE